MKKLLYVLIVLLFFIGSASADVQVLTKRMIYSDSDLKAGQGLELRAGLSNWFIYGSNQPFQMFGQWSDMRSIGAGASYDLGHGFYVFGKVGYDMPDYDANGFGWEGVWFYQNQYLSPTYRKGCPFHHYQVEIDDAFTGEIGLEYKHKIYKALYLGLSGSYKVARHEVSTFGLEPDGIPGVTGWQVIEDRDFGGYNVGFMVGYDF